jgi:hypothetical protein
VGEKGVIKQNESEDEEPMEMEVVGMERVKRVSLDS